MRTNINHLNAIHYHSLGMNVACISNTITEVNFYEKNILKTPCHYWLDFKDKRQTKEDVDSLPWKDSTGVALIAGYNNLHALDIDGCSNFTFLSDILKILNLPDDYEWISRTGSQNGFHVFFYSNIRKGVDSSEIVSSYCSNYENESLFEKMELLWNVPIVAPPSIHISAKTYSFINCRIPSSKPKWIDIERFEIIDKLFLNKKMETVVDYKIVKSKKLVQPSNLKYIDFKSLSGEQYFIFELSTLSLNNHTEEIIQISWLIMDENGIVLKKESRLLPEITLSPSSIKISQESLPRLISTHLEVFQDFFNDQKHCNNIISFDIDRNIKIVENTLISNNLPFAFSYDKKISTKESGNNNNLMKREYDTYSVFESLFKYSAQKIDNVETEALITSKCCRELIKRGVI